MLAESTAPLGFTPGPDQAFAIASAQVLTLTIANEANLGFIVYKTDPNGAPLPGSCFEVFENAGEGLRAR